MPHEAAGPQNRVTGREEPPEVVRAERDRLQATLDAAHVGSWIVQANPHRVTADAIQQGFFGLTDEEIRIVTPDTYFRRVHPDDAARVAAALEHSMTTGAQLAVTYRVLPPSGAIRWLDSRGQAAFDADGRFLHLYGMVMDVTAHKEAEAALRLSEEKYRLLLTSVDQGFCHCEIMLDEAGRAVDYHFLDVNPAFESMTGLVNAAGRSIRDLVPDIEDHWAQTYGRVVATGEAIRFQQGSEALGRFFDVYATHVGPGRFVVLFTDITAQSQADEERARHTEEIEALNVRLARAMQETHHRVKNNLQIIAALVEMQTEELGDGGAVQRIKQHVRALASIHDLLTQQAKADTATSIVSAREVLLRLLPMLQATSGDRHIKADVADIMLPVQKATSLALLVSESVSNAIKYARGEVEITLRVEDSSARLEVCDDGAGFPSGFDPRKDANTGLELIDSTARWDLRGEVCYENQEHRQGARVVVTFPLDASDPA